MVWLLAVLPLTLLMIFSFVFFFFFFCSVVCDEIMFRNVRQGINAHTNTISIKKTHTQTLSIAVFFELVPDVKMEIIK